MTTTTEDTITEAVAAAVRARATRNGGTIGEMRGDQNLLEFVDSFGFLNLILHVEQVLGMELDLSEVDLSELVQFGELVDFLRRQSTPRVEVA